MFLYLGPSSTFDSILCAGIQKSSCIFCISAVFGRFSHQQSFVSYIIDTRVHSFLPNIIHDSCILNFKKTCPWLAYWGHMIHLKMLSSFERLCHMRMEPHLHNLQAIPVPSHSCCLQQTSVSTTMPVFALNIPQSTFQLAKCEFIITQWKFDL